jgi:hypothetical protein
MRGRARWATGLAAIAALAALAGCQRTTISELIKNPSHYSGDEVTIAGKVTQSGGSFEKGAYEVDDGTARIWVETDKISLPSQGSQVAVTGLLESSQSMGLRTMPTVLQEIKRYTRGG